MLYLSPPTSAFVKARMQTEKIVTRSSIIIYGQNDFYDLDDKTYVGFTISKRTVNKAVKRNKVKRRYKAIIQQYLQKENLPNITIIFIARSQILNFSFATLKEEIINSLNKIKKQYCI